MKGGHTIGIAMTSIPRIFALAITLVLVAACDPPGGPLQDDEITFRCDPLMGTCGPVSNTPFTGALNISPPDTRGTSTRTSCISSRSPARIR